MKKLMLMAAVCLAGLFTAYVATAADTEKPKKEGGIKFEVKGVVEVAGEANAQTVTIKPSKEGKEPVKIVVDEKGKELLALNGKTVVVVGKQTDAGLVVEKFKEIPAGGAEKVEKK